MARFAADIREHRSYAAYFVVGYLAGWFESLREFQRSYQEDPTAFLFWPRALNVVQRCHPLRRDCMRAMLREAIDRGKEDTRVAAAHWLRVNVPVSARVLGSHEGPKFPTTVKTSRHSPISAEQFAIVESGGVDVFVLMSSMTTRMQSQSALEDHPEIATSHLKLYQWVKTHATLRAAFHPGERHRGYAVEIFTTADGRRPGGPAC